MAKEDSGLGWVANEGTICRSTGSMGTIHSRSYNKYNDQPAVVAFCRNGTYWQPHLASTEPEAVKYSADGAGPWNYNYTYNIDGVTWYFFSGNYGYSGNPPINTTYPIINESYPFTSIDNAKAFLNALGVEPLRSYRVIFNANGGAGVMPPQDIEVDVPTHLDTNVFTRSDYRFMGWATTPDGAVTYTDGELVTNLASLGASINLYAVWVYSPGFNIYIQRNNSEKNKLDKDVTNIQTLYGTLKNETSIIDPVIIVAGNLETLADANYMDIPAFKRKYFITNIRTIRNGIIEISAHVDVLSSFATEIRTNNAIVHKQENEWNLYLNDGTFKVYANPVVETMLFPVGFPGSFDYVLAVAGGGQTPST